MTIAITDIPSIKDGQIAFEIERPPFSKHDIVN